MEKNIFNKLYDDIDGASISWRAREKISKKESKSLIYGEMSFESLKEVYSSPEIQKYFTKNAKFCDLGSGTGKIVLGTFLIFNDLLEYYGVELLKELFDESLKVLNNIKPLKDDIKNLNKIHFLNDNFFNTDLSDFDIIFMHYPIKIEKLYLKLEEKMKKELKKGTLIISGIRSLRNTESFSCILKKTIKADYGNCTMYYYIKV